MNQTDKDSKFAENPYLAGSLAALRRAALKARQIAACTNTDLIIFHNGKSVRLKLGDESELVTTGQ